MQEASDLIRQHARQRGCNEREVIDASPKNFDWQEILASATSMSLFSERKLVEIRLPSGKPGAAGSKALCTYVDIAGPDDVLLLIAGKIDKQCMNSKWVKTLDKKGAVMQLWPIGARDLPRWLQQRVANAGMSIDRDALQLLSDRVEGNLLAAVQEVEKLKLLSDNSNISAKDVTEAVSDNARYNLFEMVDSALRGTDPKWLVEQGERFYLSLGFEPLPASFWTNSDLYELPADATLALTVSSCPGRAADGVHVLDKVVISPARGLVRRPSLVQ